MNPQLTAKTTAQILQIKLNWENEENPLIVDTGDLVYKDMTLVAADDFKKKTFK